MATLNIDALDPRTRRTRAALQHALELLLAAKEWVHTPNRVPSEEIVEVVIP
jgi:hypothetical protein